MENAAWPAKEASRFPAGPVAGKAGPEDAAVATFYFSAKNFIFVSCIKSKYFLCNEV